MSELTDVIELPQCPCCSSDLSGMMTRVYRGVRWCHLCSFDVEEMPREEQDELIEGARQTADEIRRASYPEAGGLDSPAEGRQA